MPTCYQLVGVPGSGKTTWASNQDWAKDCAYISTDQFVEAYAKKVGSTYSEVFKDYMPVAVNLMAEQVVLARKEGRDIIWDQTSTTISSRTRKFNMLPNYRHVAVVFKTPDEPELSRRLDSRPGKEIPDSVMRSMVELFESPDESEGFSEIWYAA